jgi:import inner membrane translocase subunit TIM10
MRAPQAPSRIPNSQSIVIPQPHTTLNNNRFALLTTSSRRTARTNPQSTLRMSYLFGGRPQVSSEQKIAQAEAEIDMVSDMYTRYDILALLHSTAVTFPPSLVLHFLPSNRSISSSITPSTTSTYLLTRLAPTYRLVQSCSKKCVDTTYREGDLNKGESVCLDRCVSKFFEVNVKVSEKMQGEAQGKQAGGGMFGA